MEDKKEICKVNFGSPTRGNPSRVVVWLQQFPLIFTTLVGKISPPH